MQSSSETDRELRAPLATFDTVDLGEEYLSIVKTDNSLSSAEIDRNAPNINYKLDNVQIEDQRKTDECDGSFAFPVVRAIKKLMHTNNYQELSNGNNKELKPSDNGSREVNISTEELSHFSSDSNSDSSDSESGYVRSGYIAVSGSKITQGAFPVQCEVFQSQNSVFREDDSSFDNTPISSPILPRVSISTLLGELQNERVQSKRKALEKRIQRLQVTTKPVERPRSTTPINVHTFDEYVEFSSPEKSPFVDSNEKLKIKLPGEEFNVKPRSPWKNRSVNREANSVFSFNEDQLFTRTKSALVVQNDGTPGPSPKRVLIPPSLSPAISPSHSPSQGNTQTSARTVYIPKEQNVVGVPEWKTSETAASDDNWVAFDQRQGNHESENWFSNESVSKNTQTLSNNNSASVNQSVNNKDSQEATEVIQKDDTENSSSAQQTNPNSIRYMNVLESSIDFEKIFEEEFLTVQIEEVDGNKICDVKCEPAKDESAEGYEVSSNLTSHTNNKPKETSNVDLYSMKFDLIEEIEKEMRSRSAKETENYSESADREAEKDDLSLTCSNTQ